MKAKFVLLLVLLVIFFGGCLQPQGQSPKKIGIILPLSGAAANLGDWVLRGAEIAKEEINSAGGIGGKPLEFVVEDDQCTGSAAITAFEKLVSVAGVPVVIGPLCNAASLPVATPARTKKIPFIATGVTTASVRNSGEFTFTVLPPIEAQTKRLANFAVKDLRLGNVSIIFVEDEYGKENESTFREALQLEGTEAISSYSFARDETDFRSILAKIGNEETAAILLVGYSPNFVNILKQLKELGIEKTILSVSNIQDPKIIESVPAEIEGIYYTYPELFSEDAQKLTQAYGNLYGEEENLPMYIVAGYSAVKKAAAAIAKCDRDSVCIQGELGSSLKELPFEIVIKTVKNGRFVKYNGD